MISSLQYLPYPCFVVGKEFQIIESSKQADIIFPSVTDFLALIDSESYGKALHLFNQEGVVNGELVMITRKSPQTLYSLGIHWFEGQGYIICTETDPTLNRLIETIEKQRMRLADTDFELFEKKEQLEKSLYSIRDLSGPFIKIAPTIALIPLYGILSKELMEQNTSKYTEQTSIGYFEQIIFDFHGIGEITEEGLLGLESLITQLKLLGANSIITGINPQHAVFIKEKNSKLDVLFINNLNKIFKKIV